MAHAVPKATSETASRLTSHLVELLSEHRASSTGNAVRPLIVGLQGPQGSGKTTLTTSVRSILSSKPHSLHTAIFSLDDLYLPHEGLLSVAASHPGNALLSGRGQPGTHDVALGASLLSLLRTLNEPAEPPRACELPAFDKSLRAGAGDRASHTIPVRAPIDVVLFEGWSLGFYPLEDAELERRYDAAEHTWSPQGSGQQSERPYLLDHPLENLRTLNTALRSWVTDWYPHIDAFVQLDALSPQAPDNAPAPLWTDLPPRSTLERIFSWRLQAEREMRAANGGHGMSDAQVRDFVQRYMPAYELFAGGVRSGDAPWAGKGLRFVLDSNRSVVHTEKF